jgi:hypothetical protein
MRFDLMPDPMSLANRQIAIHMDMLSFCPAINLPFMKRCRLAHSQSASSHFPRSGWPGKSSFALKGKIVTSGRALNRTCKRWNVVAELMKDGHTMFGQF